MKLTALRRCDVLGTHIDFLINQSSSKLELEFCCGEAIACPVRLEEGLHASIIACSTLLEGLKDGGIQDERQLVDSFRRGRSSFIFHQVRFEVRVLNE